MNLTARLQKEQQPEIQAKAKRRLPMSSIFGHLTSNTSKPNLSVSSSPFCSSSSSSQPSLNRHIFSLLDACKNLIQITQIHAHLITRGLFDSFWARKLLKSYSDFRDFDYVILIFRYIDLPGTFCVNTVIKAYSVSSVPDQALVVYFEWLRNGFAPTSYTFVPLVWSCAKMGSVESGRKCHGQVVKHGLDSVLQVQNSLIHMYCSSEKVELARMVFDEMSERDLVSWNTILDGYSRFGDLDFAHRLFDEMPERNVVSWNVMLGGYWKGGKPGCALKLFRKMMGMGLKGTALPWVEVARRVFESRANRNLVCWNAMILGHCIHGNPKDGLNLYSEMVGRMKSKDDETIHAKGSSRPDDDGGGIIPDEITFIGVLCACARAGLEAEEIIKKMPEIAEDLSSESLAWPICLVHVVFKEVSQWEKNCKVPH
ncbi:pentatricopeptide repeat-containing protein [Prunus yedoensis var. nudiflora]|uniref:Pentatricopeptide repeat-containing protein n=1 Tax=Prunus yedoensis var. nudiflora TaxID=2094558 RepID=A0A314U6R9_PRUYE|nr:pentatricopeptide repeat-containing protein [Prunus yedoensis var. nudiflora]